jgi:antitoxin component of MazEF toxin-antitoxin module
MKLFTKKLRKGEIDRRVVNIPRFIRPVFPPVGIEFNLCDGETKHIAKLDNKSHLQIPSWFQQHKNIVLGDEITLSLQDENMCITDSRSFALSQKEVMNFFQEVIDATHNSEIWKMGQGKKH